MVDSDSARYVGEILGGEFAVTRLIGTGGFAWVYHATNRQGREAAIKVLHTSDKTATLRFARETRVLKALPDNPSVAGYVGHGRTRDDRPFLAIEYVDGITLQEGLNRCPILEPRKAVAFVAELCQAFGGLHALGVAHRDVKPDNILLLRRGGIKLVDFGLIRDAQGLLKLLEERDPLEYRVFDDELDHRILAGTPEYMAPEQFADAALHDVSTTRTDTWSDVFSLGVILFQLLVGRPPFPMRDVEPKDYPGEILRYMRWRTRIADKDIPPCPMVDDALRSILHKSLRHDPGQRQPDARELEGNLRRYLETGQGVSTTEVTQTVNIDLNAFDKQQGSLHSAPTKIGSVVSKAPEESAPDKRTPDKTDEFLEEITTPGESGAPFEAFDSDSVSGGHGAKGIHSAATNIIDLNKDDDTEFEESASTSPFIVARKIQEKEGKDGAQGRSTDKMKAISRKMLARRHWPDAPTIEEHPKAPKSDISEEHIEFGAFDEVTSRDEGFSPLPSSPHDPPDDET